MLATFRKGSSLQGALLLVLAFSLTACGSDDSKKETPPDTKHSTLPQENPDEKGPDGDTADPKQESGNLHLLVFFGGYTSCIDSSKGPDNMDMTEMFTQSFDDLTEKNGGKEPAWFLSCYGLDPNEATYMTSENPGKKLTRAVKTMEKDLATFARTLGKPALYIAGHSYGAYTALKLLSDLDPSVTVKSLFTIDAISKIGCTPEAALPAVLGGGPAPKGCLEAPSDITKKEQERIKARVGTWINYYQTDSQILHSGEFAPAENIKKSYDSGGFTPHNDLVFDEEVITEISAAISASAGLSLTAD